MGLAVLSPAKVSRGRNADTLVSCAAWQYLANLGHPTVASVYEPQGFGHIGIVRPGEKLNGPALAQAGVSNVNHAHVYDFFHINCLPGTGAVPALLADLEGVGG